MSAAIRTRVVKIGNSQGIRIPKPLLEQSGIGADVEMEVQNNCIVIRAATQSRVGWDQAFAEMAEQGDDHLLDPNSPTDWDQAEWEW